MFEQKFAFSQVVFVHMRQFHSDFYCFDFLDRIFFLNGSPNPFIVRSRSSFCLVNENSLNCTSGLVMLCFGHT